MIRAVIPPLRQRPEDLAGTVQRLLDALAAPADARAQLTTPEFVASLRGAAWPGNVRELRNHLERCLVFRSPLPPGEEAGAAREPERKTWNALTYAEAKRSALVEFERSYVEQLVAAHGGNVSRAAQAAEVDRAYLYRLLRRHRDGS